MGHNRNLADYAHHFDGTHIDLGSGNIETQGVLTYEDVTNVDAIGIITARTGVKVPDSQKVFLGTGDDLQIYHNATDSFIVDNSRNLLVRADGTGDLYLQSDNKVILSDIGANEIFIECNDDADVKLFYNNNQKLATTTTGATVTGTLVSDSVTSELDLSAISSSISDTAVDVFVYDTRKDSDGGAWRKRTQHTSWYNETLNTSTRGSRKAFPAVAVIVATSSKVTIHDGDDPDLPMWMIFEDTAYDMINTHNLSPSSFSLSAKNGNLLVGSINSNYGEVNVINFISDSGVSYYSAHSGDYKGNISQRNDGLAQNINSNYGTLVNQVVNDVAMTVLPNAPIDDATGLPVPTIAVATNAGVSVIKDTGDVVDAVGNTFDVVNNISFDSNNRIICSSGTAGTDQAFFSTFDIPSSDASSVFPGGENGYYRKGYSSTDLAWFGNSGSAGNHFINDVSKYGNGDIAFGTEDDGSTLNPGLKIISENITSPANGMLCGISTSYNTGWMHGDIKGAFLSDTDTTNATYTTVADDWATAAAWTKQSSISLTSTGSGTSGTVSITGNGTGSNVYFFNPITVEANTDYVVTITFGAYNANDFFINTTQYSTSNQVLDIHGLSGLTRGGHFNSGSNTTLYIQGYQVSTTATTITNVVVQKVSERDRSVNNKGLQVFGTVTKSAVATGADLVAYSGNGTSNYLEQPYNSDLDFGANSEFSVMGWMYNTNVGGGQYIFDRSVTYGTSRDWQLWVAADLKYINMYIAGAQTVTSGNNAFPNNAWFQFVVVRTSGYAKIYINGVEKASTASTLSTIPASNVPMKVLFNCNSNTKLSLFRMSSSVPSPEEIKKIYEDEKMLFQENAKSTLYGSSDAVTALAYDEDTELLHVGTSAGRSDFQGLRRINNTTTAVTTAISASDELIAEQ